MLQQFLDNLKEKKTSILGVIAVIVGLLPIFFPGKISGETAGDINQTFIGGYDLLISIVSMASGIVLLIARIFPKKL